MRTLHIHQELLDDSGPEAIAGTLIFPDDPNRAFEYFVKQRLLQYQELKAAPNHQIFSLPASWIRALVVGDSLEELAQKLEVQRRQGETAAALLHFAFVLSQAGKQPTFNHASTVVEQYSANVKPADGRAKVYGGKSEISKAWLAMRDVAHVHLAARMTCSSRDIRDTLGLAVSILERGKSTNQGTKNNPKPWLSSETAWHIPDFIAPLEFPAVNIEQSDGWLRDAIFKPRKAL